jgi:hypothetical protein
MERSAADEGADVQEDGSYSLQEVVSLGFEASAVGSDRTVYFWHHNWGVRIERRTGKAHLVTDPSVMPDLHWKPTSTGARELEIADGLRRA